MNLEELRISISSTLTSPGLGGQYYLLIEDSTENSLNIREADIEEESQDELTRKFAESIGEKIIYNTNLNLINLSSADDRSNAIYLYDIDEIPPELRNLESIVTDDNIDLFSFEEDSLSKLKGILVLIGDAENQIALYKHHHAVNQFKRDSFIISKFADENRFVKLGNDVLRIGFNFDFFRYKGNYYILNLTALERFFGFHEAIKNRAAIGVEKIKSAGLLSNPDVLTERFEDITFTRKLVRSSHDSPVLGKIPNNIIINFVRNHPFLQNKLHITENGDQIELLQNKEQDIFLRLLNDDYLQSELTKTYYETLAKDGLS